MAKNASVHILVLMPSISEPINVGDVSEIKLTDRQRIIIAVIRSNPSVSAKQMSETLSVTSRTIERDLTAMQKAGIIRHEGTDNVGIWVILEKDKS